MKIGSTDISAVKIGATDVNKVYLGSNLVWEKAGATLLLDLYPNAAAAYSLRKLRTAYVGSAIRVRRSSDNTEQDIGFVNNELDTASLLSFVGAGDGFVSVWYDQSGGGNDVAQVSDSAQPQIVSSGVVEVKNGKPTINKDGLLKGFNGSALTLYNSFGFSNFSVSTNNSVSTGGVLLSTSDFNTEGFNIFADTRTPQRRHIVIQQPSPNPTLLANLSKQYFAGEQVLLSSFCGLSGNLSTFDNNNVGGAVNIPSVIYTNNTLNVGYNPSGGQNFNGSFQEVIIYPSDQSANRAGIETNINNHYTIY